MSIETAPDLRRRAGLRHRADRARALWRSPWQPLLDGGALGM